MSDWVKEAKERCEAATPGPWKADVDTFDDAVGPEACVSGMTNGWTSMLFTQEGADAQECVDAGFIRAARSDLPMALSCIEAADALAKAVDAIPYTPHKPAMYEGDGDPGCRSDCPSCARDRARVALAAYRKARAG